MIRVRSKDGSRSKRVSAMVMETGVSSHANSTHTLSTNVSEQLAANRSAVTYVSRSTTRSISPRNCDQVLRPDLHTIRETIRGYTDRTNVNHAPRIADDLHRYFQTLETPITGLRTLSVNRILHEKSIIAWREGQDVDVLAFCKVPDRDGPCSWLMHLGFEPGLRDIERWSRASVRWIVSDLEHLKELLKRAQHTLGIFRLSEADLSKLSDEKYKDSAEGYMNCFNLANGQF
jgi:hypothetical protein